MAKQLNVDLSFTADTSRAKASIQDLQRSLSQLSSGSALMSGKLGINSELAKATTKAGELKAILSQSTNSKGLLDLSEFQKNLQKNKTTLSEYASHLRKLGPEGKQAFQQLAKAVSTADVRLQKTTGLVNELWIAMKNTMRWQLTSSTLHTFIGGLQSAYGYAQNLNSSLNNIRIVSGKSTEEMSKFAKEANTAAKNLGNSTLDYTRGALIYYQQGLEKQQVDERTNVTMKMKNVTGDSAEEVSSYMTAIWNNFNKAGDEAVEHYGDVLTALGASTASSTAEIAGGLEKFAAVSDTIGLSYENAASALATIVATTRQSEDVVGTALKTMFARMEGLKIDGAIEDDGSGVTSLNQYSEALMNIGVNIKDASGQMKSMDDIIQETGTKWQGLSQDVKIATAQKVAGMRQYTQFMALMDNFNVYQENLRTALNSDGTLQQQQEIYEESWEAANNRLKASFQGLWDSLINDEFFITLTNGFAAVVEGVEQLTDAFGGLRSIIPLIGMIFTKMFREKISTGISDLGTNISNLTKAGRERNLNLRKEAHKDLIESQGNGSIGGTARAQASRDQGKLLNKELEVLEKIKQQKGYISEKDKEITKNLINQQEALSQKYIETADKYETADKELTQSQSLAYKEASTNFKNNYKNSDAIKKGQELVRREIQQTSDIAVNSGTASYIFDNGTQQIKNTKNLFKEINDTELSESKKIERKKEALQDLEKYFKSLRECIDESSEALKDFDDVLDVLEDSTKSTEEKVNSLQNALNNFADINTMPDEDKFLNAMEKSGINKKTAKELWDNAYNTGIKKAESTMSGQSYKEGTDANNKALDEVPKKTLPTAADAMTGAAEAAMSLSMAYSTCSNALSILNDEHSSLGDRLSAILMSIGTVIPAITSLGNALKVIKAANYTGLFQTLGIALPPATTEVIGLSGAFSILKFSMMEIILPIGLIIGLLGAFAYALKEGHDQMYKFRNKFEEAGKTAQEAKQHLTDITSAVTNLNSSMESIDSKREALTSMSRGTAEWTKALNDLNSEATDAVQNINQLNDNLGAAGSEEYESALGEVNKALKDAGLNETSSLDMISGEDYYYDSTGAFQYTEAGHIKFETVQSIMIDQAQIALNAAEISAKQAEIDANKESVLEGTTPADAMGLAADSGSKSITKYRHSDEYNEEAFHQTWSYASKKDSLEGKINEYIGSGGKIIDTTKEAINEQTYDNITDTLSRGDISASELTRDAEGKYSEALQNMIDTGQLTESQADLIVSNSDLREQLVNSAQVISENTAAMNAKAESDIVKDAGVNNAIYGENSGLTPEEQEKYGAGITKLMGEDAIKLTQKYEKNPEQLYEEGKKWEDYKGDVARDLGYKESGGKYYKTNEDGTINKNEEVEITEDVVNGQLAYNKALEETKEKVEAYKKLIKDTEKDNKALANVKKIYEQNAKAIDEASDALKNNKKLSEKQSEALKKFAKDASKDLAEALDLPKGSMLDPKFVGKNLDIIKDAMDGDVEAIQKVQKELANWNLDHLNQVAQDLDLNIDLTQAKDQLSELNNILQTDLKDYEVGVTIDDADFTQGVADATAALMDLGVTGDNVGNAIAASLGGSVEVVGYEDVVVNVGEGSDSHGNVVKTVEGSIPYVDEDGKVREQPFHTTLSDSTKLATNDDGKTVMRIPIFKKSANVPKVSSGGGGPSRGGSGGGGKGGGGGRGGGGRRATRRARHQAKEQKVDPYHTVNKNLDSLSRKTEKVKEKTDQLYGKKRLSNMDEVNKRLKAEIDLLNTKSNIITTQINKTKKLAQEELKYQRKKLKKLFKKNIINSTLNFDEFGNIKNYNDILDKLQKKRDSLIDQMNKKKTEEAQNKFKEKYLDPLDESIENIKQSMESYEAELQNWLDYLDSWSEKYNQILENKLETFNYKIEINAQINDNASKIIDYYLEQAEKDTYKMGEVFNLLFSQEGGNKLDLVLKQITKQDEALKDLDQMYKDGYITQANYVESLQKIFDSYGDNLDALNSLKESMEDYYSNVLEEAMSSLSNYQSLISQNTNALNHWKQVLDILGSGKNYSKILELQKQITNSAKKEYDNKLKTYEALKQSKKNLEEQLSQYEVGSEQYKILSKDIDNINEKLADSANEAMEAYENMLNSMQEELKLQLDQADKELDNFLSGVTGGFEELQKQMELASTRQQEYLTTTNKIYEMNKMLRNIRKDIDKTDNKAAKDRLNNFAKEISGLKEKDKLSQLDLKIAEARYKQLQAQIALEESQNAKTTVRLMRDNEGNYGYVYTSNEDEVTEKEQAVEDAGNSLYNIVLDANNDYNQKIVSYTRDMVSSLKEIRDSNLTDEEKAEQSAAVMKYYGDLISDAQSMLATAQNILGGEFNALNEAWSNSYSDNVNNMLINANDAIMNWSETSQTLNNQLQQLYKLFDEKFIKEQIELAEEGQEKFDKIMEDYFGKDGRINKALDDLSKYLKEILPKINEALKSVEKSFSKVGEQIANEAIGNGADSAYYSRFLGNYLSGRAGKTGQAAEDFINKIIQADPKSESSEGIYDEVFGKGKHGYFYFKDGKIYASYTDGNSIDDKAYKKLKDRLKKEGAQDLIQFESGGYTGKWGDSQGKLALLHEKELILNKDDTKNMLATVDIVRKIVDVINVNSIKSLENLISPGGVNTQNQELNQNVQISAEFPNVQDRYEIEAAFDNLVNKAAQYAGRNKD